jgi:hypothetical protein
MMELAANIGGTVTELKQRMTYTEALQWRAYARKQGGLPLSRLTFLLASLCTMFSNANGGKATLHDFLPEAPEPPDNTIQSAEQFFTALGL